MKELNKDRLRAALDRLPQYEPERDLWPAIAAELSKTAVRLELPGYSPPSSVWNAINSELDRQRGGQARIRRIAAWAARAAAVLLLFGAGYWSATRDPGPTIVVAESVERAPIRPTFVSTAQDEPSFERILGELEQLNRPSLNDLRYELGELTFAKEEIEGMLVGYGQDAQVINKLAQIERERSAVYRRILAGM